MTVCFDCEITKYILEEWDNELFDYVSGNTLETYKRQGKYFIDFVINEGGFDKTIIERYLKTLKNDESIKQSTRAARSNAAKVIISRVSHLKESLIPDSICKRLVSYVKWIQAPKKDLRNAIPSDKIIDILEALNKIEDGDKRREWKAQFALMALHGLRASELCSLKKKSFSFATKTIEVISKGGKERKIEMFDRAVGLIRQFLKGNGIKEGYLFTYNGEKLSRNTLSMRWKRFFKTVHPDLSEFSPHSFRHYLGTQVAVETGDLFAVMSALGHTSSTASAFYIGKEKEKQVHSNLEKILTII